MTRAQQRGLKLLSFDEIVSIYLVFKDPAHKDLFSQFCKEIVSINVIRLVLLFYAVIYGIEILHYSSISELRSFSLKCATLLYIALLSLGYQFIRVSDTIDNDRKICPDNLLVYGLCVESVLLYASGNRGTLETLVVLLTPLIVSIVFLNTEGLNFVCCIIGGLLILNLKYGLLSTGAIITYFMLFSIIMYENRRQLLSKFILHQNLKIAMRENERSTNNMSANEMRHLIANVAHDLKTVSLFILFYVNYDVNLFYFEAISWIY